MLIDSVGQEFGQGPSGREHLCSIMSETSAGGLECWWPVCHSMVWGWNHPEMSLLRSEVDTGCHLGCVPEYLNLASLCGFFIKVGLGLHIAW